MEIVYSIVSAAILIASVRSKLLCFGERRVLVIGLWYVVMVGGAKDFNV